MNTMLTLLKREYWEHRLGFVGIPAIISGILVLMTILLLIPALSHSDPITITIDGNTDIHSDVGDLVRQIDDSLTDQQKSQGVQGVLHGLAVPLAIALLFTLVFYSLSSLYDDRKNRSFLFWKSMPVSDLATVVSKALSIVLVAPILLWLVTVVTQFAIMLIMTIPVWMKGVSPWDSLWAPSDFFVMAFRQLFGYLIAVLWLLPVLGWLVLVSAWAKRAPFLIATMVIVLLLIAEGYLFKTSHIGEWIGNHFAAAAISAVWPMIEVSGDAQGIDGLPMFDTFPSYGEMLTSSQLWIGIVIFIGFLVLATFVRRFRDAN